MIETCWRWNERKYVAICWVLIDKILMHSWMTVQISLWHGKAHSDTAILAMTRSNTAIIPPNAVACFWATLGQWEEEEEEWALPRRSLVKDCSIRHWWRCHIPLQWRHVEHPPSWFLDPTRSTQHKNLCYSNFSLLKLHCTWNWHISLSLSPCRWCCNTSEVSTSLA